MGTNKCHICDQEFDQLELHFLISHTSQTVIETDIDKKEVELIKNISNEVMISVCKVLYSKSLTRLQDFFKKSCKTFKTFKTFET